ncbi:MAG: hypothetical protein M3Y27_22475, partial [Acidobacteriota bacterium]|nr:hypothetical protein [Acidobacteriota bacterium]
MLIAIGLDSLHVLPGWFTFTVTTQDGAHSSSYSIPFFGDQNLLALSASGELNFLDQAQGLSPTGQNGYIRVYKPDGTPD